jgi:hypothetical protein
MVELRIGDIIIFRGKSACRHGFTTTKHLMPAEYEARAFAALGVTMRLIEAPTEQQPVWLSKH